MSLPTSVSRVRHRVWDSRMVNRSRIGAACYAVGCASTVGRDHGHPPCGLGVLGCVPGFQPGGGSSILPARTRSGPFVYQLGCLDFTQGKPGQHRQGPPVWRVRSTVRTARFERAHEGSSPSPASTQHLGRRGAVAHTDDRRVRLPRPRALASFNGRTSRCGREDARFDSSSQDQIPSQRVAEPEPSASVVGSSILSRARFLVARSDHAFFLSMVAGNGTLTLRRLIAPA